MICLLFRWRWNDTITVNSANDLTKQGIDDMKYLARRTQTRFPEILKAPYSDLHYHVIYVKLTVIENFKLSLVLVSIY